MDAFDEDLLAGAGPVGGVLLNARGGKSKRLMSRVIPGERQTLRVEGRRVWVQRQPAPPEEEDDGSGQRRNNGRNSRRRRNGGAAEEGSTIPKGAFKITVSRRQGVETFGALLASARAGFLASRRGKLLTYEAVTVNDDGTYGESPEDDWSDLCWDDDGAGGAGGGFVSMLGMSRAPPQLVWHSAPSFRAVSPGQVILPHGHESAVASLIRDVSTFLDSSGWYAQRGIPFRRGYIVHGPAGCGKSMVTAAVATELKLTVYCVDLARPGLSDEWLASLLSSVNPRSVIVFERVDKAFDAKRRRVADPRRGGRRGSSAALTFSGLLNALDGVCAFEARTHTHQPLSPSFCAHDLAGRSERLFPRHELMLICHRALLLCSLPQGSITVFTSELPPDQLDEALTRPGRCDYAMHVPQATPAAAAQLFSRFFSSHPRFRPTGEGELEAMSREFEAALERRQQQGQPGVKPFSMRDVVSFVCTRSPRQAVAEVDALGIDAAEAAARSLVAKRQQGLGAVAELLPPAALGEEAAAGAREVAG